jgi:hypothetical protein
VPEVAIEVVGRQIVLGSGAVVWVGRDKSGQLDGVLLQFTSAEGEVTRLRLSTEAALALEKLLATGSHHQDSSGGYWSLVEHNDHYHASHES